jgi:hypothetical protein
MAITDEVLQFYGGPYDGGVVMFPSSAGRMTLDDSFGIMVQRNTNAATLPHYLRAAIFSQRQQHRYMAVGYELVKGDEVALVTVVYMGSQANGLPKHSGQKEEGWPQVGDQSQEAEGQEENKVDGT